MMIADDFSLFDADALGCSSGGTPLNKARAKEGEKAKSDCKACRQS
jgi:hypothetical protein